MCGIVDTVGDAIGGVGDLVGGAFDFVSDLGLDNILATVGTVVPGPWTPFAVGYNVLDNAAQGNWLGAGLSAFGGMGPFTQGLQQLGQQVPLSDIAAAAGDIGGTAEGLASGLYDTVGSSGIGLSDAAANAASSIPDSALLSFDDKFFGSGMGIGETAATAAGGLSSLFDRAKDFVQNNRDLIKGGLKIGGSIADAIGARQAQKAIQNNINTLNDMYSAQSPYAEEMRRQLARKDAARGRRSQYGTREVQLANALTQQKASILNNPYYLQQLGASSNSTLPYGSIARGLASLF